ncbi:hypothetical protein Y032_0013g1929 [Ancylostoma ceylanicum]|nr:hypothetical protein Y032_0013g1929 [Ancylostoma ceylanicum]
MESGGECEENLAAPDIIRIVLIVGMGTTVCLLGIVLNTLLLLSFSRLQFRNTNLLYLFLLAVFDIFVELSFMLMFPSALIWEYFRVEFLYVAWHHYIRYISTCAQVLIAASTLLIVSASFERYVCSFSSSAGIKSKNRMLVIAVVILSAIIMKGSVYFELELQTLPNCRPLTNLRLDLSEITRSDLYKTVWMFWCRNFLNVFLPFSLLLLLNSATIANLNKHSREFIAEQLPSLLPGGTHASLARRKKKDATRTLAALVTIYLLSNTLNLLLTIMEFIDPEFLRELGEGRVYNYLADLSSLLTISSTASRLPVYYHCNHEIRKQLRHFFGQFHLKKQIAVRQQHL